MDRVVALKRLRSDYTDNEKFWHRLFREARAAGCLGEPRETTTGSRTFCLSEIVSRGVPAVQAKSS